MRGPAADDGSAAAIRHEDVAADESGGQAQRSHRLHHEDREVPAAAATPAQRFAWTLNPFFNPPEIAAFVLDAARHRQQQPHRGALAIQVARSPRREIVRRVIPGEGAGQIRALVIRVRERKVPSRGLEHVVGSRGLDVLERHRAVESQLRCLGIKAGDRDRVVEHIVQPAQFQRLRPDVELRVQQPQIVAGARAKHHAVLTEPHRLRVRVGGDVPDGQEPHGV